MKKLILKGNKVTVSEKGCYPHHHWIYPYTLFEYFIVESINERASGSIDVIFYLSEKQKEFLKPYFATGTRLNLLPDEYLEHYVSPLISFYDNQF